MKCPWCRAPVARGQKCPECGRAAAAEVRPLGGGWSGPVRKEAEPVADDVVRPLGVDPGAAHQTDRDAPNQATPRPTPRPPSPVRDPRAAWERRQLERAEEANRYAQMGYWPYLRLLVREDQVFGALLAWMTLNAIVAVVYLGRAIAGTGMWPLFAGTTVLNCAMLAGTLTLQRWAHTVVVWLAGMGLLGAAFNLFGRFLSPLFTSSVASWGSGWLAWLIQTATLVFVLVVLCERTAYFEGVRGRVPPKRRRLRDVWASAKRDLRRVDPYEQRDFASEEPIRPTADARRTQPSAFDRHAQADTAGRAGEPSSRVPAAAGDSATGAGAAEARGREQAGGPAHSGAARSRGIGLPPRGEMSDLYRVERGEPAPGQAGDVDWAGVRGVLSWRHVRAMARDDAVFAVLLVLLGMQALLTALSLNFVAMLGTAAIIWGILTLQRWAYWFAILVSGGVAVWHLRLLAMAQEMAGPAGAALYGAIAALNVLVIVLLVARHHRFG